MPRRRPRGAVRLAVLAPPSLRRFPLPSTVAWIHFGGRRSADGALDHACMCEPTLRPSSPPRPMHLLQDQPCNLGSHGCACICPIGPYRGNCLMALVPVRGLSWLTCLAELTKTWRLRHCWTIRSSLSLVSCLWGATENLRVDDRRRLGEGGIRGRVGAYRLPRPDACHAAEPGVRSRERGTPARGRRSSRPSQEVRWAAHEAECSGARHRTG